MTDAILIAIDSTLLNTLIMSATVGNFEFILVKIVLSIIHNHPSQRGLAFHFLQRVFLLPEAR